MLYEDEKITSLNSPFEGYRITSFGRVIGKRFNKELKYSTDDIGYKRVRLYSNGKPSDIRVHRLVAEHFLENENSLPMVNHKDGNKFNAHIDNLEWVDAKENAVHASKTGLLKKGEEHHSSRFLEEEVLIFIELINNGLKNSEIISKHPRATNSVLNKLRDRSRWKHLFS